MSATLRDLVRDAIDELHRTQYRNEPDNGVWVSYEGDPPGAEPTYVSADRCVSCGAIFLAQGESKGGHFCKRARLIADLEAALREGST